MSNQVPTPTLRQLDGTVNAPGIDAKHREDHRSKKRNNGTSHGLQETTAQGPAHKVCCAEDEDGDGEELEDDTGYHDVCAGCGVSVYFVDFDGGHAAADGLDDQGDDVAGAEDPEVEAGFKD